MVIYVVSSESTVPCLSGPDQSAENGSASVCSCSGMPDDTPVLTFVEGDVFLFVIVQPRKKLDGVREKCLRAWAV